jgi:hypothetical protein
MEIVGQELVDIASEIVSTVEGASGIGIEYEDVVDIICEILVEKFNIGIIQEPSPFKSIDKLEK